MFKNFTVGMLCIILSLLIAVGSVVYIIDPFNVYRADEDMTKIIYQMPYYQNVGIAKHTKYDTLITGSSMTQNFRAWWFDDTFGCKAIRLSYDGGISSDYEALLKAAVKNTELKTVYFGLDNYMLTADSELNEEENRTPEYLIDDNYLNDIKYLLNKDILFNYLITYFSYKKSETYDFYEMHAWDTLNPEFSNEAVLSGVTVCDYAKPVCKEYFIEESNTFFDKINKIVEENPNIEFVFFAPPYSIIYWYNLLTEGKLEATVYTLEYVYSKLLLNDNVRIFYFQNDFSKITDLDSYKDANHYCTDYNRYMLECFASGNHEIFTDNLSYVLAEMKTFVENYDYFRLINENNK